MITGSFSPDTTPAEVTRSVLNWKFKNRSYQDRYDANLDIIKWSESILAVNHLAARLLLRVLKLPVHHHVLTEVE